MAGEVEQHFRPEEAQLIDAINQWITQAIDQYSPVLTHFMNPRQRYIAQTLVNRQDDVSILSNGGFSNAEMQRLLIYPTYYQPEIEDFQIQVLDVKYPEKFAEIKHRQILGTLVSQGIERETFGDIITDGHKWQVMVEANLSDYIRVQVDKIANIRVQLIPISLDDVISQISDAEEIQTTVSSLRLDAIIASSFNYSRNRSKELIEHGKVRLNWEDIDKPDYPVAIHDLISVRHGGRIKLTDVGNPTKKNKLHVSLLLITAN
ncbi:YlmH/Sll1252 family protein [Paucilactobacillus suebicus]|uniref:RNA-binding S4 domain-containing protein n=1 Tax=Paucilactobacillus suebicus DSM 5007 = KCTC 3549 TaxID=1423807 RepID=A0A0R1WAL9_9LACO|nr:YlmH/Sll1252 family protein [Paucilactobacillus suebicus]KRM12553.1 RNA-binding S4 domain-containing protein [Paucilactobacillus suebicus DSM 5007 = KCTC 3549]